jgi:cysteine desulfurase/selenocysteine lyase
MARFNVPATIRASFALYNTVEDVDALVGALVKIRAAAKPQAAGPAPLAASRPPGAGPDPRDLPLQFPSAAAASPAAAADEFAGVFEMLDDRDARNEYVLDLGGKLPQAFDTLRGLGMPRIPGCMSEVYLIGRKQPGGADVIQFAADANAEIVRGLIAILQKLFSGQRASDVLAFDVEAFFRRIGLDQFISAQRRNGLAGMVQRIKSLAAEIAQSSAER